MNADRSGVQPPHLVVMGHFTGPHGLRGWVKVFSHTQPREGIFRYQWWIGRGGSWQKARHHGGRRQGKTLVVKLEGVDSPEQAEALRNMEIAVSRAELPDPGPDSWYWTDLEGLLVVNREGIELGRVSHLFETGANDVMVVQGERERLIPFTPGHTVDAVDLEQGRIRVDWDAAF